MNIFIFQLANASIITFRIQKNASDAAGVLFFHIGQDTLIAPDIACAN